MYNIFILTEGGGNTGMGHISRCLSVYQAFEKRGYRPQLIINGATEVSRVLNGIRYHLFDWINEEEKMKVLIRNADVVLIDSYKCPQVLYQQIAYLCSKAVFIDDNIRLEYPSGIVVNGVMGAEKLNYPIRTDIDYLLGAQYAFLRSAFWDIPSRNINSEVKSAMISCGGNDVGLSSRITKIVKEQFPALKISVVVKDILQSEIDYIQEHANVFAGLGADDMKKLMNESDIAITAAGQTTYELCRMGTPFVALLTADNQAYSIANFFKNGLVQEAIKPDDEKFEELLISQVKHLIDPDVRKKIAQKMQICIDGSGSVKLADYILHHI